MQCFSNRLSVYLKPVNAHTETIRSWNRCPEWQILVDDWNRKFLKSSKSLARVQSWKFKFKVADNNALFATLLALIVSLITCVKKSLLFWRQQLAISKEDQNVETFSSRRMRKKRLSSEPLQRRFWVRPGQTSVWWDNAQAGLAIVLDIATTTLKNAAKSLHGLGLRMPTG